MSKDCRATLPSTQGLGGGGYNGRPALDRIVLGVLSHRVGLALMLELPGTI